MSDKTTNNTRNRLTKNERKEAKQNRDRRKSGRGRQWVEPVEKEC